MSATDEVVFVGVGDVFCVRLRNSGTSPDCSVKATASVHLYMSVSEATRPFWGAEPLPASRRKFSIRPSRSISSRIMGMLVSTSVFLRRAQNPSVIVTARMGMLCSLA